MYMQISIPALLFYGMYLIDNISSFLTPDQVEMLDTIISSAEDASFLLLESPTGSGKTTAAILASIVLSLSLKKRVIFSVRNYPLLEKIFRETLSYIKRLDVNDLLVVSFRGKEKSCPYARVYSLGTGVYSYCEYLRSYQMCEYYNNYIENYGEILGKYRINTEIQASVSQSNTDWCPYYVMKTLLKEANIVVTHYFNILHYFGVLSDPQIFSDILIIDEVHNLPRIFFEIYSPSISLETLSDFCNLKCLSRNIRKLVQRTLLDNIREITEVQQSFPIQEVIPIEPLYVLNKELLYESLENEKIRNNKRCRELFFTLRYFCDALLFLYDELFLFKDNRYVFALPKQRLYSLPTILTKYYSVIGLSATLTPINLYKRVLFNTLDREIRVFRGEYVSRHLPKIHFFFKREYTSKYTNRSITLIERVSKDILQIVKNQGSSIVFSASQELSKYIKNELYRLSPQYPVSLSIIDLDESDTFPFTSKDEIKLVLASQRGRFNEGIEFPQDIRNIIVFGLSITPPSLREQLFAKYILGCNTAHEIFTYGYLHPAVTVLVQSIGRLIRRGKKEINVYIFENRVFKESILKMMPQWFKEIISEYIDVPPA